MVVHRVVVHRMVVHTLPPRFWHVPCVRLGLLPVEPCVIASSIHVYGNRARAHTHAWVSAWILTHEAPMDALETRHCRTMGMNGFQMMPAASNGRAVSPCIEIPSRYRRDMVALLSFLRQA
jgi:hypothetical protein